jgi:hypothetical protein
LSQSCGQFQYPAGDQKHSEEHLMLGRVRKRTSWQHVSQEVWCGEDWPAGLLLKASVHRTSQQRELQPPVLAFQCAVSRPLLTPTRGHARGPQNGAGQPLLVASPLAGTMTAAGRLLGPSGILDRWKSMWETLVPINELLFSKCACWVMCLHVTSRAALEFWFASETPAA